MGALQERRARLLDALYRTFGEAATWSPLGGGSGISLTVRRKSGEGLVAFGDSQAILGAGEMRVRKSEIAAPAKGDRVALVEGGEEFKIGDHPYLTPTGQEWVLNPVPVTGP